MLTVRDIRNKEFSRTRSAGYSIEEVNAFLDEAAETVACLTEEKNVLSGKALKLSEKLEAIRDEQEIWRKSIITTQKSYDEVIDTARKQAADIVATAQREAEQKRADFAREIADFEAQINDLKEKKNSLSAEIETFRKTLLSAYEKHIALIRELPVMKRETVVTAKPAVTVPEPTVVAPVMPAVTSPEPTKAVPAEPVGTERRGDLDATIVLPKDAFGKKEKKSEEESDDGFSDDVKDFISKIDTSRVTFDRDDVLVPEEPNKGGFFLSDSHEKEDAGKKKNTGFVSRDEDEDDGFESDSDDGEHFAKKSFGFTKREEKDDEDDGDDGEEERESVLKALFSGGHGSRKKNTRKKKSRFFIDDDDEESEDIFDDDEE